MELFTIEKLDNKGRGICYYNGKITFVKNALPGEVVEISITKESKSIMKLLFYLIIKKVLKE